MKNTKSTTLLRSGWMIVAVVLLVATLLSINWYYYDRTKRSLDENLSFRLRTIASLVSSSLEPLAPAILAVEGEGAIPPDTLVPLMRSFVQSYDLSNILVIREDGTNLATLQPDLFPPGEVYPNWIMDYEAIIAALEGAPRATELYRAPDGTYLKAGYAPFPLREGSAAAVVAVEASAGFLEGLGELRTILMAATAVSIVGIILFTWFALKATGSLLRARESLMHAETLASMGRMAAGIAHEIRNPLFIIRSAAEKLKETHPGDAGEIDGFIIEEADRLNGILTDYLLFARDEPTSRQPLDLVTTLGRSVMLVRESTGNEGIEIETRFNVSRAPFSGEEKRLQQAFLNILLNAGQALGGGGTITVTIDRAGDEYRIAFTDTGPGIPEKDREAVFEPFYTTKQTGSGLGLAIVRKIVQTHGGRIEISGGAGGGTTVTVRLPAAGTEPGE